MTKNPLPSSYPWFMTGQFHLLVLACLVIFMYIYFILSLPFKYATLHTFDWHARRDLRYPLILSMLSTIYHLRYLPIHNYRSEHVTESPAIYKYIVIWFFLGFIDFVGLIRPRPNNHQQCPSPVHPDIAIPSQLPTTNHFIPGSYRGLVLGSPILCVPAVTT